MNDLSLGRRSPLVRLGPVSIAAIYLLVSALWIPAADWFLEVWVTGEDMEIWLRAFKDSIFVIATTVMLYLLIRHSLAAVLREQEALRQAHGLLEKRVQERTAALEREIAERRLTETALRESEERFRQLAENIQDVFWMTSPDGRQILYISPAYEMIWGCSCQKLYEQPADWLDTIIPEDRERVGKAFFENVAEGRFDEQYLVARSDGSVRWIRDRGFPIRDERGEVVRIAGIAQDITKIKQAEMALTDRVRQQAAVADLSQRALAESDLAKLFDETVLLVGQILGVRYCKLLELSPDSKTLLLRAAAGFEKDLIGRPVIDVGPDSQAGYTLLSREPVIVEDLRAETRFRGAPLLRERGVVSGMSVIIQGREKPFGILGAHTTERRAFSGDDIHFLQSVAHVLASAVDRKRMEEQMQQQQMELAHMARLSLAGEMATGLAHELNQPLTAIAAYVHVCLQILHSENPSSDDLVELLNKVTGQSVRAGEIIRRLRAFVRKMETQREAIDINELIHDTLRFAEVEARQRGVRLCADLTDSLHPIRVDYIQIQQVVLNLVRNSIEALETVDVQRRLVTVQTAFADHNAVKVSVSDTGPTLSEDIMGKLFEPFFTTKATGMGLGLSISRSIVEAHGGRLWAVSNGDRGTTFHFTLAFGNNSYDAGQKRYSVRAD